MTEGGILRLLDLLTTTIPFGIQRGHLPLRNGEADFMVMLLYYIHDYFMLLLEKLDLATPGYTRI